MSFVDILGLDKEASASLWDYQFLARPRDGGTLKYLSLSCEISALSCELTPVLTEGTKIATWSKNGVDTDIYAPTGGGGGGEETTLKGNTYDSTKIGPGDLNFKSGDYSNVEIKTDGTDIILNVFYL